MSMNSVSPSLHTTYQFHDTPAPGFPGSTDGQYKSDWTLPPQFASMSETISKYMVHVTRNHEAQLGALLINGRKTTSAERPPNA
jgi:hypothetical protein